MNLLVDNHSPTKKRKTSGLSNEKIKGEGYHETADMMQSPQYRPAV
jgi:hypothetical protein